MEVSCTFRPSDPGADSGDDPAKTSTTTSGLLPTDLSERILDALVDEHGREQVDGGERAWFRKRHDKSR